MLVRCHGQRLDYRPIAGTRRRGATETEDWMLSEDLKTDEKEVAEHMMLVDLGRNDLGRVSDYGSVKVEQLMTIRAVFSRTAYGNNSSVAAARTVWIASTLWLRVFRQGTVTGAPKIERWKSLMSWNQIRVEFTLDRFCTWTTPTISIRASRLERWSCEERMRRFKLAPASWLIQFQSMNTRRQ
jgi:hypothetical protein